MTLKDHLKDGLDSGDVEVDDTGSSAEHDTPWFEEEGDDKAIDSSPGNEVADGVGCEVAGGDGGNGCDQVTDAVNVSANVGGCDDEKDQIAGDCAGNKGTGAVENDENTTEKVSGVGVECASAGGSDAVELDEKIEDEQDEERWGQLINISRPIN
ncbi:hypothetical protein ACROYT_G027100 [Oculina patagonica]